MILTSPKTAVLFNLATTIYTTIEQAAATIYASQKLVGQTRKNNPSVSFTQRTKQKILQSALIFL